jgi:putative ABC transport system permease protein
MNNIAYSMKQFFIILNQILESGAFALEALRANRIRTFLSTLGITIGIFCIIMVLSIVDSLEKNLQESVESLGKDVAFVEKWPWEFGPDYKWWKYMNRPNPNLSELKKISEQTTLSSAAALTIDLPTFTVKSGNRSAENVKGVAASFNYSAIRALDFTYGRFFTESESNNGDPVAIIGWAMYENLFPGGIYPIDKLVKINGRQFRVCGVVKKEGESLISNSMDNVFVIPVKAANSYIRVNSNMTNSRIHVKAKPGIPVDMLEDELKGVMRSIRKLRPMEEADFAVNKTTMLSEPLKQLFSVVSIAGWVIGGFAMLVGGFGIANIMFVSVKERTQQIGIQKSLGAKNYFILIEFLVESVLLCIVGGTIGLLLVYLLALGVKEFFDLNLFLSYSNIILGLMVSVAIGIISGFIPAWSAAKLDPVEAIRAK